MKFAATAVSFGALDAPRELPPGAVELALEGGSVPSLSASDRRIGFNGTKEEAIDRTPAVGRLRLAIGLGRGVAVELAAIPPVELDGLEPRVVGAGLVAPIAESGRLRLAGRLGFEHGLLTGDITCSRADVAAGDDPQRNPFGCAVPSADRLEFDLGSAALALSLRPTASGRIEPYLAVAAYRLSATFQVRASYQNIVDRTRLETRGSYWSAALGATAELDPRWRLTGELFYAPLSIQRPGRTTSGAPLRSLRLAVRRALR